MVGRVGLVKVPIWTGTFYFQLLINFQAKCLNNGRGRQTYAVSFGGINLVCNTSFLCRLHKCSQAGQLCGGVGNIKSPITLSSIPQLLHKHSTVFIMRCIVGWMDVSVYVGVVHKCCFQQWSFKLLLSKQAYNKTLMSMMDFQTVRSVVLCHFLITSC